jgi:hypothetical protein
MTYKPIVMKRKIHIDKIIAILAVMIVVTLLFISGFWGSQIASNDIIQLEPMLKYYDESYTDRVRLLVLTGEAKYLNQYNDLDQGYHLLKEKTSEIIPRLAKRHYDKLIESDLKLEQLESGAIQIYSTTQNYMNNTQAQNNARVKVFGTEYETAKEDHTNLIKKIARSLEVEQNVYKVYDSVVDFMTFGFLVIVVAIVYRM